MPKDPGFLSVDFRCCISYNKVSRRGEPLLADYGIKKNPFYLGRAGFSIQDRAIMTAVNDRITTT